MVLNLILASLSELIGNVLVMRRFPTRWKLTIGNRCDDAGRYGCYRCRDAMARMSLIGNQATFIGIEKLGAPRTRWRDSGYSINTANRGLESLKKAEKAARPMRKALKIRESV